MLSNYRKLIENQYEAAICTLTEAITRCPEQSWQEPVARFSFNQSAFHALFFADLYLGKDIKAHDVQEFHTNNDEIFRECGQWDEYVPDKQYSRDFILKYLDFCRHKMKQVVSTETESELNELAGFSWLASTSRSEVHVYNIRHIQHHAAQLILALRRDTDANVPWVKTGWEQFGD